MIQQKVRLIWHNPMPFVFFGKDQLASCIMFLSVHAGVSGKGGDPKDPCIPMTFHNAWLPLSLCHLEKRRFRGKDFKDFWAKWQRSCPRSRVPGLDANEIVEDAKSAHRGESNRALF